MTARAGPGAAGEPAAGRRGAPARLAVFANAFVLGAVVMGFEMLGSRYLYPYFGGDLYTWAALIATVLLALMAGYWAGGYMADLSRSPRLLALLVLLAGVYLALMPLAADDVLTAIIETRGDGLGALLAAALALLFVPIALLGTYCPFAVKLLLWSTAATGRTAGAVFGVSTLGNIFGTLFTTIYLMPVIGSRAMTQVFGAVVALCALSLLLAVPRGADR
ncbi:MAG: fused MFS/spermidine synthase [Rhodospirillaceae bacterium]|nr:fused MFS/spermidine synthase [Rhodospirillaceae bacterium]